MSIHKEWICRYVQVLPRESGIHNFFFITDAVLAATLKDLFEDGIIESEILR